jgi:predicted DNA-binding ribbon-helix-helix protein
MLRSEVTLGAGGAILGRHQAPVRNAAVLLAGGVLPVRQPGLNDRPTALPTTSAAGRHDGGTMIRKTMRLGDLRTSVKLEPEFWSYLKEVADGRKVRLSSLVDEVAQATPDRTNLASTLRLFALRHAKLRTETVQRELDRLSLLGNSQDLTRVLEACPMPSLILDADRGIRQLNRAFALWLNLDPKATVGKRLENIMILRGTALKEMWVALLDGRLPRGQFTAAYVSPGRVRTSQAVVMALADTTEATRRGLVVQFETTAGRQ